MLKILAFLVQAVRGVFDFGTNLDLFWFIHVLRFSGGRRLYEDGKSFYLVGPN